MLKILQQNENIFEKYTEDSIQKYINSSCFFLQTPKHILYQNKENLGECIYFIWVNDKKIIYSLAGVIENNIFYSPFKATFGSFCFEIENINSSEFSLFIQEIKIFLQQKKVKSIHIKNFPMCYAPEKVVLIENILFQHQFQLKNLEINFHIELDENIWQNLHLSQKRRYQKCVKNNFIFQKENKKIDLVFVHQFIQKSRERKNYPMTLNQEKFINLIQTFPQNFEIFSVKKDETFAALCVTIVMNEHILYSFYPADNVDFLSFSPLVFLFVELGKYAMENNFKLLDLGIATDKSVVNEGLFVFKKRLGAKISSKSEWICVL
ncbi:MAG: hypothetical protein EAZ85_08905 [Bacteroidetes bacterium]|nr:MAG: hypothetical protein EAZ85_08905 [Bacteroidota bacterium]TAG88546.1 MAG: hypothetical protein EAZ20_08335 [Bacteroidota bacterium]